MHLEGEIGLGNRGMCSMCFLGGRGMIIGRGLREEGKTGESV